MTESDRTPIIVHARMSTSEMVAACGLRLCRATLWTYSVYDAANKKLYTGSMAGIKKWLRQERWVA